MVLRMLAFVWVSVLVQPVVDVSDLEMLEGETFRGELIYLDYRSGNEVSIPAALEVSRKSDTVWSLQFVYPEEPSANSTEELSLEKGGSVLASEDVVERSETANGVRLVTERLGTDDDRKAWIRTTYMLAPESLSMRKEVRFDGEDEFFMRNEFRFSR